MQYCTNNTYRDWANLSDTEGGHQPSVTVVKDSSDDDDDGDTPNNKALKRKVDIATIVAGTAMTMSGLLALSLVWLGLAFQDLRKQMGPMKSQVIPPAGANSNGKGTMGTSSASDSAL